MGRGGEDSKGWIGIACPVCKILLFQTVPSQAGSRFHCHHVGIWVAHAELKLYSVCVCACVCACACLAFKKTAPGHGA